MALITCKECKSQVSDEAKTCPNCGAPVPQPTSRLAIFIAGFFGLIVFSSIYNSKSTEPAPAAVIPQQAVPPIAKLDCVKDEAVILLKIKTLIKDSPNVALETLRPCTEQTGNPLYKEQIANAEKQVKQNADDDQKRLIDLQKRATQEAKEQAKLKKSQGIQIGMTMDDVRASSWGKPQSVNRTTTATSEREQWVYGMRSYLYFHNGVLTSIQN